MTDQTELPAPEGEKLSDFWERLHNEGVDMKHGFQMKKTRGPIRGA